MKKVYSTGHPQIEAGTGDTIEAALLNFVKNADSVKTDLRTAFKNVLGTDVAVYLKSSSGSKTFRKLDRNGVYGTLVLEIP